MHELDWTADPPLNTIISDFDGDLRYDTGEAVYWVAGSGNIGIPGDFNEIGWPLMSAVSRSGVGLESEDTPLNWIFV